MTPASLQRAHDRRRAIVLSLIAVLIGGVCGWTVVFAGMKLWGLMIGAAVGVTLMWVLARRGLSGRLLGTMLGYGFAFVLLTWPLLWLVVGYVRFLITGRTLGN